MARGWKIEIQTRELAAQAQDRHEAYLNGQLPELDDAEVEEAPDGLVATAPDTAIAHLEEVTDTTSLVTPSDVSVRVGDTSKCDPYVLHGEPTRAHSGQPVTDDHPIPTDDPTRGKQTRRSKRYSKRKRNAERDEHVDMQGRDEYGGPPKRCAKKRKRQADVFRTDYTFVKDLSDRRASVTRTGFTGKPSKKSQVADEEITKDVGLAQHDLTLIDWDGK